MAEIPKKDSDNAKRTPIVWENGRYRKVDLGKVPFGAWLLTRIGLFNFSPEYSYRLYILALTFCCYAAYHMSRKPFSVVAHVLAPNCTLSPSRIGNTSNETIIPEFDHALYTRAVDPNDYIDGWPPFNGKRCKTIIGAVDYAWLFTYAIFMVGSGLIADRVSLRYFLTVGMIGSGIFVGLLGVAYYAEIHEISYFIVVQIFVGIFESTGWPAIVSITGNWLGISRRGLVMGIWNAHTSVGNILGTAIPAIWAVKGKPWSWAFLVPGFVMIFMAVIVFFFLIIDPTHVGLPPPKHHKDSDSSHSAPPRDYGTPPQSTEKGQREGGERKELLSSKEDSPRIKSPKPNGYHKDRCDDKMPLIDQDYQNSSVYNGTVAGRSGDSQTAQVVKPRKQAIGLIGALRVPGVIEFAMALFFAKLVAYTFLFWLPYYVTFTKIGGRYLGEQKSNLLSTLYDVGGIVGGIITGGLSDLIGARAISCVIMMYLAVPTLFMYRYWGPERIELTIILIIFCGLFVNGPYALITTAVSSDLGTHKSLKDNQRAKATVGAIIDGMGSLGAAVGPLLSGWVSDDFGWDSMFYVLMFSCFTSSLMLTRLLVAELKRFYEQFKNWRNESNPNCSKCIAKETDNESTC